VVRFSTVFILLYNSDGGIRLLLFLLRSFLLFVLLNFSVQDSCTDATVRQIRTVGGVLPFDPSYGGRFESAIRSQALVTFGILQDWGGAWLMLPKVLRTSEAQCPREPSGNCMSFYLIQRLQFGYPDFPQLNLPSGPGFLTLTRAPIYDIVLETLEPASFVDLPLSCKTYDRGTQFSPRLQICAGADDWNNQTYVLMRKSPATNYY
jgi:hypothetical protein